MFAVLNMTSMYIIHTVYVAVIAYSGQNAQNEYGHCNLQAMMI